MFPHPDGATDLGFTGRLHQQDFATFAFDCEAFGLQLHVRDVGNREGERNSHRAFSFHMVGIQPDFATLAANQQKQDKQQHSRHHEDIIRPDKRSGLGDFEHREQLHDHADQCTNQKENAQACESTSCGALE
ncbi:MAG: hypothetical protein IPP17_06830 [Bacteroidetes bacterium]|nr:hypothetical protein [Bacteroidota bacterium]